MPSTPYRLSERNALILYCVALVATVFATLWPALWVPARSDQLNILYLMADRHSLWENLSAAYSLQREEILTDFILYRPVLFWELGFFKWLFGYSMLAWQALSIAVHALTTLVLFFALRRILRPWNHQWVAFLMALGFGVNLCSFEMATWHHIFPYSLGMTFLILSGLATWSYLEAHRERKVLGITWSAWILGMTSILAAFTYETFAVTCAALGAAAFGIGLYRRKSKLVRVGTIHFLAGLSAVVASLADFYFRFGKLPQSSGYASRISLSGIFESLTKSIELWTRMALLPQSLELDPGWRLHLAANWTPLCEPVLNLVIPLTLLGLFILGFQTLRQKISRPGRWILLTSSAAGFIFLFILVTGRMAERGVDLTLTLNMYYPFFFLVYATIALAALLRDSPKPRSATLAVLSGILLLLNLNSIFSSHQLALKSKAVHSGPFRLISEMRRSMERHQSDSDFSFRLGPLCEQFNMKMTWYYAHPEGLEQKNLSLAESLCPNQYRPDTGRYVLLCQD